MKIRVKIPHHNSSSFEVLHARWTTAWRPNTVRTENLTNTCSSAATSLIISRRQTYSRTRTIFHFSTAELFENTTPAKTAITDKLSSKKTHSSHYFMQIRRGTCDRPWCYANMQRGYSQELAAIHNAGYRPSPAGTTGGIVWSSDAALISFSVASISPIVHCLGRCLSSPW